MELQSKWFSVEISIKELLDLIPSNVYYKIEKQILKKAKEKFDEPFTLIDLYDSEGRLEFGIGT